MSDRWLVTFLVEGPADPQDPNDQRYPRRDKIVDLKMEVERQTANDLIAQTMGKLGQVGGFTPLSPTGGAR